MQTVLSAETNADIRRYMTAVAAYLAYEHRCEIADVFAAIEPLRADAPGAQTVTTHQPVVASPAGSDAVAIPAFLRPQPRGAGLPEVTASGSHSPETATKSTAVRKDAPFEAMHDASPDSAAAGGKTSAEAATKLGAGTQVPPVDTITENAPDPAQAGDDPSTSPAPNQEPAPPPMAVPASEPTGSDNAGEAIPHVSPATKLTLFQRVSAAHAEHPDWTARQIAALIKRPVASVQTTLAVVRKAASAAEPAQAREPARAPEPPAEPETPPAIAAEPPRPSQALTGRSSPSVIVQKPVTKPKGTLFWLRDDDGEYLHMCCHAMTRNRKEAWTGTEAQLLGCRTKFPLARDLREQVVEKEGAR